MSTSLMFGSPSTFFRNELRNMLRNDVFGDRFWDQSQRHAGVFPPVNILDDGESFLVRAEMPGVSRDSLDVSCKDDQLVIRGERTWEAAEEGANYHRQEREAGSFRRAITLPQPVNPDKVEARYQNGILEVYLPRAEAAKPRKITVG